MRGHSLSFYNLDIIKIGWVFKLFIWVFNKNSLLFKISWRRNDFSACLQRSFHSKDLFFSNFLHEVNNVTTCAILRDHRKFILFVGINMNLHNFSKCKSWSSLLNSFCSFSIISRFWNEASIIFSWKISYGFFTQSEFMILDWGNCLLCMLWIWAISFKTLRVIIWSFSDWKARLKNYRVLILTLWVPRHNLILFDFDTISHKWSKWDLMIFSWLIRVVKISILHLISEF